MTSRLLRYEATCAQRRCLQCGSVPLRSDIKGMEHTLPYIILISLERQLRYNFAADSFYIMLIFALDKLNIRHISTSGLVDLLSHKVCHVMRISVTMKVSTKFEVETTIRCLVIALSLLIRYVTL